MACPLSLNLMNKLLTLLLIICSFQASSQTDEALVIADSLYALGDYNKAIELYRKVNNTQLKIAKSYEAMGNNEQALAYYKQALLEHANATIATYNYGKLLLKTANYQGADSIFQVLQTAHPRNPNFPYHLGLIKEKQKDSTAIVHFNRALTLDGSFENARYKIAKRLAEKREFEAALFHIDYGLAIDPNSIRFLNLRALASFHTKNYHEALSAYKKLLKFNQSNIPLHENLAVSFTKTNQFEKAIEQYTVLINEFDDKNPKWHYLIGRVYMSLRDYEKARRHLEIAILLKDLSVEAEYWALSDLFGRQKEYKKQMKALEKMISENPQNEHGHYFLAAAADNYFENKNTVIPFYENYLKKFGETGRFRELARQRLLDLKTELHFKKD